VVEGCDQLSSPTEEENSLEELLGLHRGLRLACQTRALGPATVRRLNLSPGSECSVRGDGKREEPRFGAELDVTILFADIRHFTAFSESLLPYDVTHALNRFFQVAGGVVDDNKGEIGAYFGDGFMGIFGGVPKEEAALRAVRAGLGLIDAAAGLQPYLRNLYGRDFSLAVGVHCGKAVVGNLGNGPARVITAIGDAVNTAARVEWANRTFGTALLVSEEVRRAVGDRMRAHPREPIELPGKTGLHTLYEVEGIEGE
jgi:adenylate cyclase